MKSDIDGYVGPGGERFGDQPLVAKDWASYRPGGLDGWPGQGTHTLTGRRFRC